MTKEIKIKQSWSEITIKDYIVITNILNSEYLEEDEKIDRIITVLSDLSSIEVGQLKPSDYTKVISSIKFIKDLPKLKTIPKTISIDGRKFIVDTKLGDVVTGQYLMLQNIMKGDSTFEDRLKQVLAVFIRPKDCKWGEYDFEENSEFLYNNLSIEIGYGLAVFFSTIASKLLKVTQHYLMQEKKMMLKQKKNQ